MRPKLKSISAIFILAFLYFFYKKTGSIERDDVAVRNELDDDVEVERLRRIEERKRAGEFEELSSFVEDKEVYRCEAKHFGCFTKAKSLKYPRSSLVTKNLNELASSQKCIEFCSQRKQPYAGLWMTQCYCAIDPHHVILTIPTCLNCESAKCTESCTGSANETCGGPESVDFFYIPNPCVKGPIEKEDVEKSSLGCFHSPDEDPDEFEVFRQIPSQHFCFVLCERKKHVLAMWRNDGSCICGRFTYSFNLQNRVSKEGCEDDDFEHVTIYKTWAEDTRCSTMRFVKKLTGKTVLTSVPSSGNTWLRYLIEKSSGVFTGSIYRDTPVFQKGYLGEMSPDTFLVKNHMYDQNLKKYSSIMFIVRNPYETMISEFKRQSTQNHVGVVTNEQIKTDFVPYDKGTLKFLSNVLTASGMPMYVVYYDELKENPIEEVRRLLEFPPLREMRPDDLDDRLLCVSEQLTGYFKRKSQPLDFDPFSDELKTEVNQNIEEARDILTKYGFKLPDYERPMQ